MIEDCNLTTDDKLSNLSTTCCFLIVFLTSSFAVTRDMLSSGLTIALWIFTMALIIYANTIVNNQRFVLKIERNTMVILLVLIFCFWAANIANGEDILPNIKTTIAYIIVAFYVSIFEFERYKNAFIRVMYFISVVSLIGFVIYLVFPGLFNNFLVNNGRYSYLILYVVSPGWSRNFGLFWEPGAFQTYLILALMFELATLEPQYNLKRIIIFVVTLLTTFSTSGYIALIAVSLLLFLERDQKNSKLKISLIGLFLVVLLFIYIDNGRILGSRDTAVFQKISRFLDNKGYAEYNGTITSASVRYYAIVEPFKAFFEKPIWGWGIKGLSEKTYYYLHGMITCTFINWFAVYGLVYGGISFLGIALFTQKISKGKFYFIIALIAIFITTMSENYVNNASIVMLILYGFRLLERSDISMQNNIIMR